MISKKVFSADGTIVRFLPDFLVRSEQFARPYVYIYDATLDPQGTEDHLQNGSVLQADWSWPDNIWVRGGTSPNSNDIATADKWQVVDNSILFYTPPFAGATVWIEVATTSEEFGTTLTQPSVDKAETAADSSQAAQAAAEAAELAAEGAQAAAEAAQLAADNAGAAALADADRAELARDVALAAQTASELAQAAAEAAQLASETAQGLSEAAQAASELAASNSNSSAVESKISRVASEASAAAASASESNAAASASAASISASNAATSATEAQTVVDNYGAIYVEDNAIDFSVGNHFKLTATAANITALGLTGIVGQSGTILISLAENIIGWGIEFKFKTVPTNLTGDETFGYFIEDATNIWIGRVQ